MLSLKSFCLLALFTAGTVGAAGATVEHPVLRADNLLLPQIRAGLSVKDFIAGALRSFDDIAGKADVIPAQAIRDRRNIAIAASHAAAIGALLRYDLNGDMRISAAEISTVEKADPPRPALAKPKRAKARPGPSEAERLIALCDTNRDGFIEITEIVRTDDAQVLPRSIDQLVNLLDSELGKDGKLTRKEITALAQNTFKAVDANADGYVSPEEYIALEATTTPPQLASVAAKTARR
jgi:Ca2+-binding EF-hand superfamily protein